MALCSAECKQSRGSVQRGIPSVDATPRSFDGRPILGGQATKTGGVGGTPLSTCNRLYVSRGTVSGKRAQKGNHGCTNVLSFRSRGAGIKCAV